jgi:hypothetical protein
MIASESLMQENLTPESPTMAPAPMILSNLPDVMGEAGECPRRTRAQLDLLMLAIEALDLTGSEAILAVAEELELQSVIKNRAALWRLRSTNPMRKMSQRRGMSLPEAKALTVITCYLARRLTVVLRQLVQEQQSVELETITPESNPRLADYLDRYKSLFRSRMHPRRTVALYDSDAALNRLALEQLSRLLFCTGTSGMQRLWISLFDGEVA